MGFRELLDHARRRHGIVTVADGAEHGVARTALFERARAEGWRSLHPGVWLVAGARDTHDARLVAALAVTGGVARGQTSLWLHGLLDEPPHPPQVLVAHARHGSRRGAIAVRRTRHLDQCDLTTVRGYPTLAVPRTILDCATGLGVRRTLSLVIDAEREGVLERDELLDVTVRLGRGVPGLGVLRDVLAELDGIRSDSDTEHDVRRVLTDLGYPVHPEPFPWRCPDRKVVDLDLALPDHWVYLEVDGFGTHSRRRVFEKDRIRWTQIVARWRPVWVTAARWRTDRPGVLADLDAAIADADPTRAPARPAHRSLPGIDRP